VSYSLKVDTPKLAVTLPTTANSVFAIWAKYHKLFASPASNFVDGSCVVFEYLSKLLQHRVAYLVAISVIDRFELVYVYDNYRKNSFVSAIKLCQFASPVRVSVSANSSASFLAVMSWLME